MEEDNERMESVFEVEESVSQDSWLLIYFYFLSIFSP